MKSYFVGLLKAGKITSCNFITSDLKEAKEIANEQGKNVYEKSKGKYYLKYIGYITV